MVSRGTLHMLCWVGFVSIRPEVLDPSPPTFEGQGGVCSFVFVGEGEGPVWNVDGGV